MREPLDMGVGPKEEGGGDEPARTVFRRSADLIPTGSTLLNLALSDNPYGGFATGTFANLIGGRSAGKTFLSWSLLAEMNADSVFKGYELFYDDAEHRLRIPVKKMFGKKILDRVELEESDVIEGFYETVRKKLEGKKPFVDILDTFDSLEDREAAKRKELKKDYPAKTSLFTEMFRKIKGKIRKTNSFLVIVSQVRANVGVMIGPKLRRTAENALGHYCTYEIWLSERGHVEKKGLEKGTHINANITKNSETGKLRRIDFDILDDYGIDDIGSMVDWLCKEKFWIKKKGEQTVDTGEDFGIHTREKLIKVIDEGKLERLIGITAECWKRLEEEIRTDRKPRYR